MAKHQIDNIMEAKDSRLFFHSLLRSIDNILIVLNREHKILAFSEAAQTCLGLSDENLGRLSLNDLNIDDSFTEIETGIRECLLNRQTVYLPDIRWKNRKDQHCYLGLKVIPLFSEDGDHLGYLISGADITRSRELKHRHAEGEKFRAIGELTAGIAHEINTPIQFVQNNLSYFKDIMKEVSRILDKPREEDLKKNPALQNETLSRLGFLFSEFPDAIDQSLEGIARITRLIKSLRNYSHPGTGKPEVFDLSGAVRDGMNLSINEWKNTAVLEFEELKTTARVNGYPSQLSQAIVNLIINACHTITERYKEESYALGRIRIRMYREETAILISVEDNGMGISETMRGRIFEPFFTTKPMGKGTGQGLAQVYSCVVQTHGGTVTVDSIPGEGSIFTVSLPGEIIC